MTNAWVASDSVNLVLYTCKPFYSSHIHFPVSKDFFGNQKTLGFSSHAMVSRFIAQVIVNVWIWLVQRQTYNPEVNIHFVTSQFRHFHNTVAWKHLGITEKNMAEPKWVDIFASSASFPKNRVENLRNSWLLTNVVSPWWCDLAYFKMALLPSQWPSESDRKSYGLQNVWALPEFSTSFSNFLSFASQGGHCIDRFGRNGRSNHLVDAVHIPMGLYCMSTEVHLLIIFLVSVRVKTLF